jgi:biopolymer transport protein ExbB
MNVVDRTKTLMLSMGAAPVMWLMYALSVVSLGVILERAWFFYRASDDAEALARTLADKLRAHDLEAARAAMEVSPSTEAAVLVAGLVEAPRGARAAREAMAGAVAIQRARLERRLAFLGTLGSNAPFLGLLGTVVGVVMAFEALSRSSGNGGTGAVMSSIAESLVATAVGLAVAIPAVTAFNYFQRRIKLIASSTDAMSRILLAHLEGER